MPSLSQEIGLKINWSWLAKTCISTKLWGKPKGPAVCFSADGGPDPDEHPAAEGAQRDDEAAAEGGRRPGAAADAQVAGDGARGGPCLNHHACADV
jgi:hypothetical protein